MNGQKMEGSRLGVRHSGGQESDLCSRSRGPGHPVAEAQTETFTVALQVATNLGFHVAACDEAFCQSRPLFLKRGPVFVTPCHGLGLSDTDLIELNVAVDGLDDAPAEFRATLTSHLIQFGFAKSLLDLETWTH